MNEIGYGAYAVVNFMNILVFLFGYYIGADILMCAGVTGSISATIVWLFSDFGKKNNREADTTRL